MDEIDSKVFEVTDAHVQAALDAYLDAWEAIPIGVSRKHFTMRKAIEASGLTSKLAALEKSRDHWLREAQRLLKSGQDCVDKLAALEDENKRLREAVEFYADRQHWRTANSSGAAMNNRGLGLGFHQTGEGQMEVLAANCGQFVVFDNWVHGGHWQADAGHIARAALSNQPTLSKDNDHA